MSIATDGLTGQGVVFNGVAASSPERPAMPDETLVKVLSASTLELTVGALLRAKGDSGLGYVFFLLARIAIASRQPNWLGTLRKLGIHLTEDSTFYDLSAEISRLAWERTRAIGSPSDAGEIALSSALEVLADAVKSGSLALFETSTDTMRRAISEYSSTRGFGMIGRAFFSRFLEKFINFYLSRMTPSMTVIGDVSQTEAVTRFNVALRLHCDQSALIVESFAGEWYSKTEYEQGIDPENSLRFVAVALDKLFRELRLQGRIP